MAETKTEEKLEKILKLFGSAKRANSFVRDHADRRFDNAVML